MLFGFKILRRIFMANRQDLFITIHNNLFELQFPTMPQLNLGRTGCARLTLRLLIITTVVIHSPIIQRNTKVGATGKGFCRGI